MHVVWGFYPSQIVIGESAVLMSAVAKPDDPSVLYPWRTTLGTILALRKVYHV